MLLLAWLIKSTVALCAGLLLARCKRLNAAVRHAMLVLVIVAVPLMLLGENLAVHPLVTVEMPLLATDASAIYVDAEAPDVANPTTLESEPPRLRLWSYWWGCYAVVSAVLLIGLGLRVRRAHHQLKTLDCIAQNPVEIRLNTSSKSPYAWGLAQPCIVVPPQWLDWNSAKQQSVLLHEHAHLRRHDGLVALVITCICALLWLNPLLWIARRRCLLLAELACDDAVVNEGVEDTVYAQHLLEISRLQAPFFAPAMARTSQLSSRIRMLLDESTSRKPMTFARTITLTCITSVFVAAVFSVGIATQARAELPDVRTDLITKIATVQVHIDNENFADANRVLTQLSASTGLSDNERAQIARVSGAVAYHEERYAEAITQYDSVLRIASISDDLRKSTLYTLAQLHFVEGQYTIAIKHIRQWMASVEDPGAVPSVFIAQAYYQLQDFDAALAEIELGLAAARRQGATVNPNWLKLRDYLLRVSNGDKEKSAPPHIGVDGEYYPLVKAAPVYPPAARQHGIEGYVVVEFGLGTDGRTRDHKIVESVPAEIFDRAAIDAVRKFKYKPRMRNGQPKIVSGIRNKIPFVL